MRIARTLGALAAGSWLGVFASPSDAAAATKVLKFGKLVDGTGRILTGATVVVEDDRIRSVTAGDAPLPAGAAIIDLSRFTGLPGLIDAHTHIAYYWDGDPATTPRNQPPRHVAVTVALAAENGRKGFAAGVTTVRDLNSGDGAAQALRDLINMGKISGPRVFASGTGIRAMPTLSPGLVVSGVDEMMRAVRQVVAAGADWIKIFGSTGGFDDVTAFQTFSYDEMKAAVDVAHMLGKKVAIHSYGPEGASAAVRAGADSLEHAADIDDATLAEMVRRKTYYVPTIDHNQYYIENGDKYRFPGDYKGRLARFIERNVETARRALKAGVTLVMGSDAVYNGWGLNGRELEWMVKLGMSHEQAIQTATKNPAAMLGMDKTLGAVAPGHFADIIAVDGDPLSNISVLVNNVRWVMKGGDVVVDATKR